MPIDARMPRDSPGHTKYRSASGKVYPEDERKVSSDVSGEVVEMYVEEGDSVRKGQILARVFADVLTSARDRASSVVNQQQAQVGNTEASIASFEARLNQAKQNYDRQKKLLNDKVISKSEFETAESQYLTAQADLNAARQTVKSTKAGVQSAQASLTEANKNLSRTTVIAPMNGIVSLLAVKKGERVAGNSFSLGTEIMRVADMSKIEVRVDVGENDSPQSVPRMRAGVAPADTRARRHPGRAVWPARRPPIRHSYNS